MRIIDIEQGTDAWLQARMQVVTGSKAKSVMGTSDAQRTLIAELIAEESTEMLKESVTTREMERGNAEEIFAVKAFEQKTGKTVDRIGLCLHKDFDWIGLSPDGLIKNNGEYTEAIEIKCPSTTKAMLYRIENMIDPLVTGLAKMAKPTKANPEPEISYYSGMPFLGIPSEYKWQVVHYFVVNEKLEKLYFVVYDQRIIDEDKKLYIVEVERKNEILQQAIKEEMETLIAFRQKWIEWKDIILPSNF